MCFPLLWNRTCRKGHACFSWSGDAGMDTLQSIHGTFFTFNGAKVR